MEPLSEESVFAAGRALLLEEGRISLCISSDGIEIKFPATRRIAAYLDVPHYYVLPYFAGMEAGGLLNRVERVGISTTPAGSKKLLTGMSAEETARARTILGPNMLSALLQSL